MMRVVLASIALCVAATLVAVAGASPAKADKMTFTLDRGVIDLGGPGGTWAKIVDPDLSPPDDPAKLTADVAGDGSLSAPASSFSFPPKRIEGLATGNALLPMVDANISISAADAISGSYDSSNGETSVSLPALVVITVYPAGSPASVAKCKVDGFSLGLGTTGSITQTGDPDVTYEAAPLAPPTGEGSLLATWASLPNSQVVSGSLASIVCPALDGMLGGAGGLWLSGKVEAGGGPGIPTKAPIVTAKPDASTSSTSAEFKYEKDSTDPIDSAGFECKLDDGAFADCSSGTQSYSGLAVGNHKFEVKSTTSDGSGPAATFLWKVTEDVQQPDPALFSALSVKPKAKKVKRGKTATIVAKVKNVGGSDASGVKICVKAPKKLVKVKACVTKGTLAVGATATAKFKVKVAKKAKRGKKATLSFKATGTDMAAKSARAVIRIG